jgi:hypothetical protein
VQSARSGADICVFSRPTEDLACRGATASAERGQQLVLEQQQTNNAAYE